MGELTAINNFIRSFFTQYLLDGFMKRVFLSIFLLNASLSAMHSQNDIQPESLGTKLAKEAEKRLRNGDQLRRLEYESPYLNDPEHIKRLEELYGETLEKSSANKEATPKQNSDNKDPLPEKKHGHFLWKDGENW